MYTQAHLHEIVLRTEMLLQSVEHSYPQASISRHEWSMWLEDRERLSGAPTDLILCPVTSDEEWQMLEEIRRKVEGPFGCEHPDLIRKFIEDAKCKHERFGGTWFLASYEGRWVGQIGIVPFRIEGQLIGRLQDVDIVPEEQGKGFGRQLLQALCRWACEHTFQALCLMAKADDWPRLWYQRFGFQKVGEQLSQAPLLGNIRTLCEEALCDVDVQCMILYGSRAVGAANEESDVDLWVLTPSDVPERVNRPHEGYVLDLSFVHPERLPETAELAYLRYGIVVYDTEGRGAKILSEARAHWRTAPVPLKPEERDFQLRWMRKMLARSEGDSVDAHYRRHWMLLDSLPLWFSLRQLRYPGAKAAFSWLKREAPETYAIFQRACCPGAEHDTLVALITCLEAVQPNPTMTHIPWPE